jgi:CBS domain-containing protein
MLGVARDILSTRIVVIDAELPLHRAQALLLAHQVEELFVTETDGRLLGVVPDYAVLRWHLLPDGAQRAGEIMSTTVPAVEPDTPLAEIAARLRMHVHARIPIVEAGKLLGVATRRALLQRLGTTRTSCPAESALPVRSGIGVGSLPPPKFLKAPRARSVLADQL